MLNESEDEQRDSERANIQTSLVIGGIASLGILRNSPPVFRKDLIPLLLDNPMSVAQIARLVRETPRDIETDLLHLLKSLKHTEYTGIIEPARCRKCGFEFDPGKLAKPSKCPECKATWIQEPRVTLQRKEQDTNPTD